MILSPGLATSTCWTCLTCIDKIMVSSVPDLSGLQSKFSHVPAAALESLEAKEVDILIGLNMAEIMRSGV